MDTPNQMDDPNQNATTSYYALELILTPFTTLYSTLVPNLPLSVAYVQQVHVKLKAEAAVMFVFYTLKQVYSF